MAAINLVLAVDGISDWTYIIVNVERAKEMLRKWYRIPILLVIVHLLVVLLFFMFNVKGETGAGWHYVFCIIDFAVYFTIRVPRFIDEIGVNAAGSYAYALYFGVMGSIQWFLLGLIPYSAAKKFRQQPETSTNQSS